MFRLQHLEYFVKIVEKGSLTKAAEALYISQPALSKQLSLLEKELQSQLFIRKPSGVELTDAGRLLYERSTYILNQIQKTIRDIRIYSTKQHYRIGALPSIATYFLPEIFGNERFFALEPTIHTQNTTNELLALLESGELDIAFVQDINADTEFCVRHLFDEPYMAVIPASHPLANQSCVKFDCFAQEKMIVPKDPCDIRVALRLFCSEFNIVPHIAFEVDFNESLVAFIAQGQGVSLMPRMVAINIRDPRLSVRKFDLDQFTRKISVVYQPKFECIVHPLLEPINSWLDHFMSSN